mmetsp:Transcript_17949/g.28989  ORF Transcript_17949/g.28989 Transcript_17949/m.28989 type:complete len:191 (-) Transcript_17949:126-698(-)
MVMMTSKHSSSSDLSILTVATESLSMDDSASSCCSCPLEGEHIQKRVSFGSIQVREYERIPGDHPETSMGVPLTIGWAFKEQRAVPVPKSSGTNNNDKKRKNVPRLGAMTRKRLLMDEFNIPMHEIRFAEKELEKFKKQQLKGEQQPSTSSSKKQLLNVKSIRKGLLKRCGWKKSIQVPACSPSSIALAA